MKWINTVKLKGRSIWEVQSYNTDSWCWKTILSLRQNVEDHIMYNVGDGKTISAWYDRWSNQQALAKSISRRVIHLAGFSDQSKLCDIINDNRWKWPDEWSRKYDVISNMSVPRLTQAPDKPIWITNNGNKVEFATSKVWNDVRQEDGKVTWSKIVWHSHCILKHCFVLWLAIKHKLLTHDRLMKWYPNKVMKCSLCKTVEDSHDHLFFQCKYSQEVWTAIQAMAKIRSNPKTWDSHVSEMSSIQGHNSIWNVIRKICFAATVYHLWRERNHREFEQKEKDRDTLIKCIREDVRLKLISIKVKDTNAVKEACNLWELK